MELSPISAIFQLFLRTFTKPYIYLCCGNGRRQRGYSGSVAQQLGAGSRGDRVISIGLVPAFTGWGNSGMGIILGPGQFNFDATIQKTTKMGGIHEDASWCSHGVFQRVLNSGTFSRALRRENNANAVA